MSGFAQYPGWQVREKLNHPVIDADAHLIEADFAFEDFLKQVGGADMARKFHDCAKASLQSRTGKVAWWGVVSGAQTADRALAMLPKLFYSKMETMGLDFAHLFPTRGLTSLYIRNSEVRQASCRALNLMYKEIFAGTEDRMRPIAVVPTFTPQEALAELDYATRELGFKAALIGTEIRGSYSSDASLNTSDSGYTDRTTSIVMDSPYDYDPLWQRFCDLKVTPMAHTAGMGTRAHGYRCSPSNYVFNHIGGFAAGAEYFCRALFFSGVTRRFPKLTFGFMEGGVAWAQTLINDIVEHWEKRNIETLMKNLSPELLDVELMGKLFEEFGTTRLTGDAIRKSPHHFLSMPGNAGKLDEFADSGMKELGDLKDLFVDRFYFGCEADDRMTAVAFNRRLNPLGLQLNAVLGSDIGHWDVMDAESILSEAYSLVQGELLTLEDFQKLTFANPARMHMSMNPAYYDGTSVADDARMLMVGAPAAAEIA